jgi:hypothetical protein
LNKSTTPAVRGFAKWRCENRGAIPDSKIATNTGSVGLTPWLWGARLMGIERLPHACWIDDLVAFARNTTQTREVAGQQTTSSGASAV